MFLFFLQQLLKLKRCVRSCRVICRMIVEGNDWGTEFVWQSSASPTWAKAVSWMHCVRSKSTHKVRENALVRMDRTVADICLCQAYRYWEFLDNTMKKDWLSGFVFVFVFCCVLYAGNVIHRVSLHTKSNLILEYMLSVKGYICF